MTNILQRDGDNLMYQELLYHIKSMLHPDVGIGNADTPLSGDTKQQPLDILVATDSERASSPLVANCKLPN